MTSFNEKFSDINDYHQEYNRYIDEDIQASGLDNEDYQDNLLGNEYDDYRYNRMCDDGYDEYFDRMDENNRVDENQRWLDYCERNHLHYDEGGEA